MNKRPEDGEIVGFSMPIEGVNRGIVTSTDGAYCYIEVDIPGHGSIIIERYWESEVY